MSDSREQRLAKELLEIRVALGRVTTFEGVIDASPTALLVQALVEDHEELEARIDAAVMLVRGWQEGDVVGVADECLDSPQSPSAEDILEEVCRLIRGGPRVPESTEDL